MAGKNGKRVIAGWARTALRPDVANRVAAEISAPPDEVPRTHGTIRLTHVGHAFLCYWWAIRGEDAVPAAGSVRPADFRALAPYVRYMHWDGERLIHRLCGSALAEGMGFDLTGTDMFSFLPAENQPSARATLRRLHTHPFGLVAAIRGPASGGGPVTSEVLFLPVAGAKGQADRIIGTIQWRTAHDPLDTLRAPGTRPPPSEVLDVAAIDVGAGVPELMLPPGWRPKPIDV